MKKIVFGFPLVIAALMFCFYSLWQAIAIPASISMTLDATPVIVVDAGHGGFDGGAVVGNVVEKDINLVISLRLRDLMRVNGYRVSMTREADISTADSDNGRTRTKKVSDMHNRLKLLESHPNAIFISIHQNKFQQSRYYGAQVFYSPNHSESETLAQQLQDTFRTLLQPENTREIKKAGSELFLLYNAKVPAVLVECGFLSNPTECEKLTTPEYQSQVALTVLCASAQYLYGQQTQLNAR